MVFGYLTLLGFSFSLSSQWLFVLGAFVRGA